MARPLAWLADERAEWQAFLEAEYDPDVGVGALAGVATYLWMRRTAVDAAEQTA